uniref:Uncharacterized protein n=1 Tax=Anguilla anguilla TaxID=7936 RepID=A0A0E9TKH1_ANGAN
MYTIMYKLRFSLYKVTKPSSPMINFYVLFFILFYTLK